ncbi:HEAT repeat domain-containing protein [Streptomyces californicus]|uniref:HEAT repeat domain-containing protein n=1 Tax=Streptomyces californicus TaxID=67351 RepID=UPI0036890CCA
MTFDHALFHADLDAQPWASYTHAYGGAEDVPGHLRALAGDDDAAADEAQSELYGSILHQGSVYEATAKAVPFLARTAAAGIRTAEVLLLLGGIAEGGADPRPTSGPEPREKAGESEKPAGESDEVACRRAVVAELPLLIASAAHEDPTVRQAAAWAAGWTGAAGAALAVPALRDRLEAETEPVVRAELLTALVELDPEGGGPLAAGAIGPGNPPELRTAAVLACADAGLPWTRDHHAAVLDLLPLEPHVSGRYDETRNEPVHHLTLTLLERDTEADRDAVGALLDAALRHDDPDARAEAAWAATTACELSRGMPARLAPALIAAAEQDGDGTDVLVALGRLGLSGASATDLLAARAEGDGDAADRALEALIAVAPERAAPLLARDLPRRPRAFRAACGGPVGVFPVLPYDPELLEAVRRRLSAGEPGGGAPYRPVALLTAWGPDASAAVPELLAALEAHSLLVPKALAAVRPTEHRAEVTAALARNAEAGPLEARFEAARALHELTGDHGRLLPLLAEVLAADGGGVRDGIRAAAATAAAVGPAAAPIVPALRAALTAPGVERTNPKMDADIALAAALHSLTGEATEAVAVLEGVLGTGEPQWRRWTLVRAAEAAARIGTDARDLAPVLEPLLAVVELRTAAAAALHAVAPDVLGAGRAADLLLDAAEAGAAPAEAVEALVALGVAGLTVEQRSRFTELAERDRRVIRSGLDGTVESADERLRARVRAAVRGE